MSRTAYETAFPVSSKLPATIITTPRITRGISTTRLVDRDLCVVRESVICLAVSERKDGKKQENEKVQGDGKERARPK